MPIIVIASYLYCIYFKDHVHSQVIFLSLKTEAINDLWGCKFGPDLAY